MAEPSQDSPLDVDFTESTSMERKAKRKIVTLPLSGKVLEVSSLI